MVELRLLALEPWLVLTGDPLRQRFAGLRERYPDRTDKDFIEWGEIELRE